jgi:transcription initiation factor TFIIIB Brf1 subunit/transcription initiation factor TFIIB
MSCAENLLGYDEFDPFLVAEVFKESLFVLADADYQNECLHSSKLLINDKYYCGECGTTFDCDEYDCRYNSEMSESEGSIYNDDDSSCSYSSGNSGYTTPRCPHPNTIKTEIGTRVCSDCGIETQGFDHTQEWRYFGDGDGKTNTDVNRCHRQQVKKRGVQSAFDNAHITIAPALLDIIQVKYDKILATTSLDSGTNILRKNGRKAVIAACLFYSYPNVGEYRPASVIQNMFQIKQKTMSIGITKYWNTFPEDRSSCITANKLIPWICSLVGLRSEHYSRILIVSNYFASASELIERSNPQSVAAATVYFYLILFSKFKKELGLNKATFSSKVGLSKITIRNLVNSMKQLSQQAALEWKDSKDI